MNPQSKPTYKKGDDGYHYRTDYKNLAKEFGCQFSIGKYGFQWLPKDPSGKAYKLFQIIPLSGWITDLKEVEHLIRERGMEL